jgi:hypothetical protein
MITKEWKDFILSRDGEISNPTERFNLELSNRHVTREIVESLEERFESMKTSEDGCVTIWTTSKVWFIVKHGRLEKLIYLPRNPA